MLPRQNKLAPKGFAARTGNFLLNLAVAVSWLLRRVTGLVTGRKTE